MTKLELIIKVKHLEADCKAYNFTQHELQEKNKELENEIQWERDTKSELADFLGKANDRVADLEDKLANADYQIEGRDLKIKDLESQIEKMKRCFNCKYQNKFVESKCGECESYSKWEIKEK